jgi:DNA-binding MarR family transcriptional regulator
MFEERDLHSAGEVGVVEFSDEDREDAVRLLTLIPGSTRAQRTIRQFHGVSVARAILEDRKRRAAIFNAGMFGEPAWELLLNLYVADQDGPRLTIGKLIQLAGTPQSTSLRWLDYLEDQGLIVRTEHPTDARTSFVLLTDKAREALTSYLSQTQTVASLRM